jgi:MFS family permease
MWVPLLIFFHGLMIGTLLEWVNSTVQDKFDVDDFDGALVLGGMALGLTLGRLLLAAVRRPWDELRLLRFSSVLGGGFFALGLAVTNYWASLAAFLVGGFIACATYPCIWTLIGNRFPVVKAKLYGYATASLALGSLIGPILVGFLKDQGVPLSLAMGICPLAGGALALSSLLWTLQDGRRAAGSRFSTG